MAGRTSADRQLLLELVTHSPWVEVNTLNVCLFCEMAWAHLPDCLYLRIANHLNHHVNQWE